MILRDGFKFFPHAALPCSAPHCHSSMHVQVVKPARLMQMVGPRFSLYPLRSCQATVTPPHFRGVLLHPEAPGVHWEQAPPWNCQRNQRFLWKFKSGGRIRSSLGSPRENSCPGVLHHPPDVPVPCERDKSDLQGQKEATSHILHSSEAPQPQDMVQMHCENPVLSINLEKKGNGATEAPIWDHLVSLSSAPAIPAQINTLFGCKKKVSFSSEQSEGTWEQQDGVRAETTTAISKVVPPARVQICLTQHLWKKKPTLMHQDSV